MLSFKEKIKEQLDLNLDVRTIRVIDKLLDLAVSIEAEEIYFEPREKDLAAVFRAAGEAKKTILLPKRLEKFVLEDLKKLAGLKMPADNFPAAGKFRKNFPGCKIIFSLSAHQTSSGEKIVISLKKEKFEILSLGRLGFSGRSSAKIRNNLDSGSGLALVIGSDDSARTAALYGILNFINRPDLNISTVEKEIFCDLPEINQSQLDPVSGFNSSSAMNSLRRQDADVIMISEIADQETAEAVFSLAGGGRFVLAGLEGRDISAGLSFLQDLSAPLHLFSAAAKMAIAVNSLERNCPYCLYRKKPGGEARRELEKRFPARLLERLRREKIVSEKISDWDDLVFYESRGCGRCGHSGVSGRVGIFEVLEITPSIKELARGGHFYAVRGEARRQGDRLLEEDALIKAIGGLITIEEVLKI